MVGTKKTTLTHLNQVRKACLDMVPVKKKTPTTQSVVPIPQPSIQTEQTPYDYLEYLLTEIPEHMDDTDLSFCEALLLWSDKIPKKCCK